MSQVFSVFFFFFFNDTATTEIYTLSLHDALPICHVAIRLQVMGESEEGTDLRFQVQDTGIGIDPEQQPFLFDRSEEHTSELQSPCNLVCRLLLEKKKKDTNTTDSMTRLTTI